MAKRNRAIRVQPADDAPQVGGAREIALREPTQVRDYLLAQQVERRDGTLSDPARLWCEGVVSGLQRQERWAMNLFARVMGWVGAETQIANVFLTTIGTSPENARTAWNAYRQVEHIAGDEDAIAAQMEQWLTDYHRARGRRVVILEDENAVS